MRKSQHGTPKRQGGISLVPALWERIAEVARQGGVSKNQVMETALMREFGVSTDSRKTVEKSRPTHEDDLVRLPKE